MPGADGQPDRGAGLTGPRRRGRMAGRAMTTVARRPSPWASEPHRSRGRRAGGGCSGHGFRLIADDCLLSAAQWLGIEVPLRRTLATSRVAVADR
jgi:hypothetical protein